MNKYTKARIAVSVFVGGFLFIGLSSALANEAAPPDSPPENPHPYDPSTDSADADLCKANLTEIGAAIVAYRNKHKELPAWLSDLVPTVLSEEALICPVTKKTGRLSPFGALDPKLRCSYLYEFTLTPITATVKKAFPGPMMSNREWKQQQMEVVGDAVPIVRCLLHAPALNLSFGGEIYESPVFWEKNFLDVADMEDFQPQ